MRVPFLAAVASAACLLSACGFVAPAPPMPPDDNRVAINQADPRLPTTPRQAEPIKVASAAPLSDILTGKSPAPAPAPAPTTPSSAQPIAERSVPTATPAVKPPEAPDTSIPVPVAPPKVETPVGASAASAETPSTATSAPPAPVLVATASTVAAVAQGVLPATNSPDEKPSTPPPLQATPAAATSTIPVVDMVPPSPEPAAEPIAPKEIWRITPADGTVRQALTRWASKADWTFGPDQWELPFDLPIQAPAEFEAASFQEATQALSQAIAMTESPIRPCFYGNRVLRMVSFNRSCNRAPAAQS